MNHHNLISYIYQQMLYHKYINPLYNIDFLYKIARGLWPIVCCRAIQIDKNTFSEFYKKKFLNV